MNCLITLSSLTKKYLNTSDRVKCFLLSRSVMYQRNAMINCKANRQFKKTYFPSLLSSPFFLFQVTCRFYLLITSNFLRKVKLKLNKKCSNQKICLLMIYIEKTSCCEFAPPGHTTAYKNFDKLL